MTQDYAKTRLDDAKKTVENYRAKLKEIEDQIENPADSGDKYVKKQIAKSYRKDIAKAEEKVGYWENILENAKKVEEIAPLKALVDWWKTYTKGQINEAFDAFEGAQKAFYEKMESLSYGQRKSSYSNNPKEFGRHYEDADAQAAWIEFASVCYRYPDVWRCYNNGYGKNRKEQVRAVDDEAERKYEKLAATLSAVGGKLLDATNVHLGYTGELEGYFVCEKGRVSIHTIIAGGYNQDIIVNVKHGQCRHFRYLIKLLKPEPDKLLQSGIDIRNTTEYTKDSRKPGNKEDKSE